MKYFAAAVFLSIVQCSYPQDIGVSTHDLTILTDTSATFTLYIPENASLDGVVLNLIPQHTDIISVFPQQIELNSSTSAHTISVHALGAGHSDITANRSDNVSVPDVFIRVQTRHSEEMDTVSTVVGWIYFAAWSISFYPQIYINFRRKSVVGLNFDFCALNVLGFLMYSLFNSCMFWDAEIQREYFLRYPRGLLPVLVNDVVFALHALFACILLILQCAFLEREDQRVSKTATGILAIFGLFIIISAGLAGGAVIEWLDFLYYCSYVKLAITLIKYVPQAYMNYKRKSTIGWSIENIFLDFTGGILSILQMILQSYNYDDWVSIFGDPTKFGLGLFSVIFDVFFMLQHYVFYRHTGYDTNIPSTSTSSTIQMEK